MKLKDSSKSLSSKALDEQSEIPTTNIHQTPDRTSPEVSTVSNFTPTNSTTLPGPGSTSLPRKSRIGVPTFVLGWGRTNQTMSTQSALDYSLGSQLPRRAQCRRSSHRVNRSGRERSSLTILWLLQLLTCAMSLDVGLVAARLVSGLHQARFSDSGLVVVRRCVADADCANQKARVALAAVATRILDAPACRLCESSTDASAAAITPRRGVHEWGGMRLNIGDVLVSRSGLLDTHPSQNCLIMWVEECEADDPTAFWVDTLHAARGTTPTSVTQWSKGTIF